MELSQSVKSKSNGLKILYCVSSIGLGHARRSLSIAKQIRALNPDAQIAWVCAEPVLSFLRKSGEPVLDVSGKLESIGSAMESGAVKGQIRDMSKVARRSASLGKQNYQFIRPYLNSYDALIQDEFVETLFSFMWDNAPPLPNKRAVITDYVRFETRSKNPLNRLVMAYANRSLKKAFLKQNIRIFADDADALPKSELMKKWVSENFHIVGPIMDDLPAKPKKELKHDLFQLQDDRRLVVFTIGGTSIGRTLVEFVIRNADEISSSLNAHLGVLLGPRLDAASFSSLGSLNLTVVPFTKDSIRYFKAADCVVTQAGAPTLNEVASLGTPCVCVPIANHWEQSQNAQRFASRYNFRILEYEELSTDSLKRAVESATPRNYKPLETSGAAAEAARLICNLLDS